jgi:hypothetical protein
MGAVCEFAFSFLCEAFGWSIGDGRGVVLRSGPVLSER